MDDLQRALGALVAHGLTFEDCTAAFAETDPAALAARDEVARRYADEDLEVDTHCVTTGSSDPNGRWVLCWQWVANEDHAGEQLDSPGSSAQSAPEPGSREPSHYLVFGRIPGNDEDTGMTIDAASRDEAVESFQQRLYDLTRSSADAVRDRFGETLFVTGVYRSFTEIAPV